MRSATPKVIRHRLLYILLLGVVTSALSLGALLRALTFSETQRLERAREAVSHELDRFVELVPSAASLAAPPRTTYVGLRAGWIDGVGEIAHLDALPEGWRAVLERAAQQSASAVHKNSPASRVVLDAPLSASIVVIGVAPTPTGKYAWAGVLLTPSAYLRPWRAIAFGIAGATALLVATSIASVLSFRRQTGALHATLVALGHDLHTPVPRPSVAELRMLADGIERMASDLRASHEGTERLRGELAQKERLAALGRVAAGVAHEVRNPLASIKLRLDLTTASHELPEPARRAVAAASDEIARLDRLVSDLLVVAGRQPGPRQEVALGALVRTRGETLVPWAETFGVEMAFDGDASIDADAESLSRAIDNLLRNAVEASPRGAKVVARIAASQEHVTLTIEDRGPGVDPACTGQIFEPFFTTKPEGTGLGLALSRAIARAHGGELSYTRQADRTGFVLSLGRDLKRPRVQDHRT